MNFVGGCLFTFLCSLSTGFAFASAMHIPTEQISSNAKLIAVGGSTDLDWTADVDILSLSSNSHTSGTPLPSARERFGSVLTNNTIYVLGGTATNEFLAYNVSANKWAKLTDFPYEINGNALVALNGSIISIGGFWTNHTNSDHYGFMEYTYKYDPQTLDWTRLPTSIPANPDFLQEACAVVYQSSIIVTDFLGNTYRSDDGANTWTTSSSKMSQGQFGASCVATGNGRILVTGGEYVGFLNSTEIYDITADTWKTAAPMSKSRLFAKTVVLPGTNDVVVCGGFGIDAASREQVLGDCELYYSEKDQWTETGFSLNIPRAGYGLFAVEN